MNFFAKITGFVVAYAEWRAAGFPRREPAWVKEIFETHCKPCEWYDPDAHTLLGAKGVCTHCSCHVSDNPNEDMNKIVWPTVSCPLTPPKWEANVEKNTNPPAWAKLKRRPKK